MVFSEPLFLFWFLPIVLFVVHGVLNNTLKSGGLFLFSLLFYGFGEAEYILLILISILFNYSLGRAIQNHVQKKVWLIVGIFFNIGLLGWFKYAGFVYENISALLALADISPPTFSAPGLPLGISFFTFQGVSYLIDVYRKKSVASDNPLQFGLFISFFPQLIAGPIVRYTDVAAVLPRPHFNSQLFVEGTKRFITGLAKKVIIANHMGIVVDYTYNHPGNIIGLEAAWVGIIAYAFQLYFDFSGYSSMAIGIGKMFGFNFPENFNYPYISQSITEYWRRWHITLGSWFKDYLYIPLGGNKKGRYRTYFNLWVVFVLVGIWHGSSWSFVLFGVMHGSIVVIERAFLAQWLSKCPALVRHLYFLLLLLFSYVIFRAPLIEDSWLILQAMVGWRQVEPSIVYIGSFYTVEYGVYLLLAIYYCLPGYWRFFENTVKKQLLNHPDMLLQRSYKVVAWMAYAALLWWSAIELAASTYNPFIYYRF